MYRLGLFYWDRIIRIPWLTTETRKSKGVRDNYGMATFAWVSATGLCKLMALLGDMSEREEGRLSAFPKGIEC